MTVTFDRDLHNVKMNRHAKYLGQSSFSSKVAAWTDRQRPTHCFIRTTNVISKNKGGNR